MLTRYFVLFAFAVSSLAGQAMKHPEPSEAECRSAVQRWSAGLRSEETMTADSRASVFAIAHEDIAIPILVNAIKAKLRDKQTLNDKWKQKFMSAEVDMATYNANRRAVDAVAELCAVDQESCPWMINKLLNAGTAQRHPLATAYEAVERYPGLRGLVLLWIEQKAAKDMAARFAQELLAREKAEHSISGKDVIISGLQPEAREIVRRAIEKERLEERQRRKE